MAIDLLSFPLLLIPAAVMVNALKKLIFVIDEDDAGEFTAPGAFSFALWLTIIVPLQPWLE